MIKFAVALTAVLALPPASAAAAVPKTANASRNWVRQVVMTPDGGFRMGNPAARVAVVEYGSLACPHCRHFEETGYKPLQQYVASGAVSYEFRNLLLNGPDIAVSLLTRCAGARNFFPMTELVYARQPQWEDKIQRAVAGLSDAQKAEMDKMTDQQRIARFAAFGDLQQLGANFGVTPARARQCLSDPQALKRLLGVTQAANKAGVEHTPTFFINGKVTDAATWDQLEPLIRQAGARG
ncbi:MAG TPA: thioredoxin domain-containing protein [Sphingomicrobium sp.]|nr:thioredoxin domain-containing protein [Sphingomicrobium sp.]